MKYIDEFRDPEKARLLVRQIRALEPCIPFLHERPVVLMEFCGGHTHTIFRYGIEQLLPNWIELVHGPGCPVCVLPTGRVDDCVALARRPEVIFATFGDAMRVPGSEKSLLQAKADGADIRMVYSPLDALQLARANPKRQLIFFALGFETTMPSTALTILQAEAQGIDNFCVFCNHITTPPIVKALLDEPNMRIDGFIAPGHVSMVIGEQPLRFVAEQYQRPIVITGFEPLDVLQSIWMLLEQMARGYCALENQYVRVVPPGGNAAGLEAIHKIYEVREFFEWRGLGSIGQSGVRIRKAYAPFDAERRFDVPNLQVTDPKACQCGEVLKGSIRPWQCQLFGEDCTPESPMGALMVSSEGACAAYYNYSDVQGLLQRREIESQEKTRWSA